MVDFDSEASEFQELGAQSTVSMSVFGDRTRSVRDEFKNYPEKRTASNKKKARPMSAVVKPSQSMSYLSSVGQTLKNANAKTLNRKHSERKVGHKYQPPTPGQIQLNNAINQYSFAANAPPITKT